MNYRKHQANVRALGCCVCRTTEQVTFHHIKSGSVTEFFGYDLSPGTGQKQNEFLGIPLCMHHHVYDLGIDSGMGVFEWEMVFGSQVYYLKWVNSKLDYDVFDMAGVPNPFQKDTQTIGGIN